MTEHRFPRQELVDRARDVEVAQVGLLLAIVTFFIPLKFPLKLETYILELVDKTRPLEVAQAEEARVTFGNSGFLYSTEIAAEI